MGIQRRIQLPTKDSDLRSLWECLEKIPNEPKDPHLSLQELVSFHQESLAEAERLRAEGHLTSCLTCLKRLDELTQEETEVAKVRDHLHVSDNYRRAVVLGGGISGMFAAAILAKHFNEVTVVERAIITSNREFPPGMSHPPHFSPISQRGLDAIEQIFPGILQELLGSGAHLFDPGVGARTLYSYGWAPKVCTGLQTCTLSFGLLESSIRNRINKIENVRILAETEVCGLVADEGKLRVVGARIRPSSGAPKEGSTQEQLLVADLFLDAGGRGSLAPAWLISLGYTAPEETIVDAFWGFSSCIYEPSKDFETDWKVLTVLSRQPYLPRMGVIQCIENNCWLVSLAGVMRDYPPASELGFLQFARSLPSPLIYDAIAEASRVSEIRGYRRIPNKMRHFNRLTRLPRGFLALGDSVCYLNPIHEDGATLAAIQTLELDRLLNKDGHEFNGTEFFRRVAELVGESWRFAEIEDTHWPATHTQLAETGRGGNQGLDRGYTHWYLDQIRRLLPKNSRIFILFQHFLHKVIPFSSLHHPAVLLPILRQTLTPNWSRYLPFGRRAPTKLGDERLISAEREAD